MIRFTCPTGQDIDLDADQVTVVTLGGWAWARCTCPHCRTVKLKEVTARTAGLLVATGCATHHIGLPALEHGHGGPIGDVETTHLIGRIRALTYPYELLG